MRRMETSISQKSVRLMALLLLAVLMSSGSPAVLAQGGSPIPAGAIQTVVPHSAYGGGWITRFFVANLTNAPNAVTINRIDQSGNVVKTTSTTLAAAGTLEMADPESNRTLPLTINWFAIGSQGAVTASVLFVFQGASAPAPVNFNTALGALASTPVTSFTALARVTTPGGDLGLALANLSNASNTLTIKSTTASDAASRRRAVRRRRASSSSSLPSPPRSACSCIAMA